MIRTQIQLYDHQVKWLKQHAMRMGVSMAHVIRESIEDYRSGVDKRKALRSKRKNALAAVGAFTSTKEQAR
jgi:hypothetical protein